MYLPKTKEFTEQSQDICFTMLRMLIINLILLSSYNIYNGTRFVALRSKNYEQILYTCYGSKFSNNSQFLKKTLHFSTVRMRMGLPELIEQ